MSYGFTQTHSIASYRQTSQNSLLIHPITQLRIKLNKSQISKTYYTQFSSGAFESAKRLCESLRENVDCESCDLYEFQGELIVLAVFLIAKSILFLNDLDLKPYKNSQFFIKESLRIHIKVFNHVRLRRFIRNYPKYLTPIFDQYGKFIPMRDVNNELVLKVDDVFVIAVTNEQSHHIQDGKLYLDMNLELEIAEITNISSDDDEEEEEDDDDIIDDDNELHETKQILTNNKGKPKYISTFANSYKSEEYINLDDDKEPKSTATLLKEIDLMTKDSDISSYFNKPKIKRKISDITPLNDTLIKLDTNSHIRKTFKTFDSINSISLNDIDSTFIRIIIDSSIDSSKTIAIDLIGKLVSNDAKVESIHYTDLDKAFDLKLQDKTSVLVSLYKIHGFKYRGKIVKVILLNNVMASYFISKANKEFDLINEVEKHIL